MKAARFGVFLASIALGFSMQAKPEPQAPAVAPAGAIATVFVCRQYAAGDWRFWRDFWNGHLFRLRITHMVNGGVSG